MSGNGSARPTRRRLRRLATLATVVSALVPSTAAASLTLLKQNPGDAATFQGTGGYSSDGLGQGGTGGTIQAEVPAGSTVVQAYLYGTYYFDANPSLTSRQINLDGTVVTLTKISEILDADSNLSTARADVTAQVAAKVGGGGGITNFAVNTDPTTLDGVALVVIYSNPALPVTTVAVLDGSAPPAGESVSFNFAAPLDKTTPGFAATMSLGSGFSFQGPPGHVCGSISQFSIVRVNSQLLTNCAGNYDDGLGINGALITVGGVGDSTTNPTPPNAPTEDDELYDLAPFLSQGDSAVTIETSNPSQDDNLFLAVISITAQATVSQENCSNGADDDGDNLVDGADPDCVVTPANVPPVANDDAYGVVGGAQLTVTAPGVLANDTDADGDGLTAQLVSQPAGGSVTLNADGSFTYTPDEDTVGTDTFTYEANDGTAASNVATVTITVTPGCDGVAATIVGTQGNDTLNGTSGKDVIAGLGGNDTIDAGSANDIVCGGSGDDRIEAGSGNDRVFAGSGDDRVRGGSGDDVLAGEDGNDVLDGGSDRDRLSGGAGVDHLKGGGDSDQLGGGAGSPDRCDGEGGRDTNTGGCEQVISIP